MPKPVRILLVEDSEDDALLLLRAIRNGGYELTYARVMTERELRAQLVDQQWDLVISDYNLGGFDGLGALKIVKETNEDLPFILVSGTVGEEVAVNAMRAGAQDYIMKSNLVRLTAAIDRELAERKRRQEVRQQLALKDEEVRQAQKMEVLGQISGGLAHDFNNILGVISLYTEKISASVVDAELRDCLRGIGDAHKRGATLVSQLLTISRKRAPVTKNFDLNRVVTEMREIMLVGLGRSNELVLDLCEAPLEIMGDPNQIEQVLMNLVLNARDAIENTGRVTIRTALSKDAGFAELQVIDTGWGMSQATLNRLFEPFFTTKDVGKGTGIGLATVYAIVKQHKGDIAVASEVGRGTTFTIKLPLLSKDP